MSKPTIQFVFRENSNGSRIAIESEDFFECTCELTQRWDTPEKERFHEERIAIENNKVTYLCGGCLNPVVIRGGGSNFRLHFKHKHTPPSNCIFEDSFQLTEEEIRERKYHGLQESSLHERLKLFIAKILEKKGYQTEVEKTLTINKNQRRRPDVLCKDLRTDRNLVFEIQMSTTFLHVIVDRMKDYFSIGYHVIWIFNEFQPDLYTTKDTYQFQNNNIFILDEEMITLSSQNNELYLKCVYLTYYDSDKISPGTKWEEKIITMNDLTFDCTKGVYYFDSKANRIEIEDKLREREELKQKGKEVFDKLKSLIPIDKQEFYFLKMMYESSPESVSIIEEIIEDTIGKRIDKDNIFVFFQWLEILNQLNYAEKYKFLKAKIKDVLRYDPDIKSQYFWGGEIFKILNHPDIIGDPFYLYSLYHLGYIPDEDEAIIIEKKVRDIYRKIKSEPNNVTEFGVSLNHFYLLSIAKHSKLRHENQNLLELYYENFPFIACIVAITTKQFIELNYNNLCEFYNHVINNYKRFCKIFIRVIDNSNIKEKDLISKKGLNHYQRIKLLSKNQIIPTNMDKLMSIIIPKNWNKNI
ncbi:MAG: hypothetical protein J1E82_03745 [Muribaculaceae bacterium]|nr:hypothetical protein [Muribaculaceae bacterium]